ncbi:MAG: glycosyltransferase family 4 protein [Oligoflexia bacterium]|nr:glycosyltransferase family 4 protein [Oligoflexia bacterium]
MKVLMFGWEFPPYISGGLGTACYGLSKQLAKKNVGITFVLPRIKGESQLQAAHDIRIIDGHNYLCEEIEEFRKKTSFFEKEISVNSPLRPYISYETYKEYLEKVKKFEKDSVLKMVHSYHGNFSIDFSGDYGEDLLSEVGRFAMIGRYLSQKEDFDVIHAHDWMTFLAGVEAKNQSKKPLIVHVHATEIDRCGEHGNQEIFNLEKYGMEKADKIIAVSNRTKDIIVQHYRINPNKVYVVHNGVDMEDTCYYDRNTRPFKDDKIVLYLGRITMQKGPDYFLEAANLVLQRIQNVRFVMAGSGDMTRKLIERMATLRIADRFHFTGFLGKSDREKLFAMSDLYIMPSVSEPFGITPLEAMRYNIPVIISKQSGVAELLTNVLKVDFWDVHRLASTIINILEKPQLKNSLTENNWEILKKMDWGIAAQKVLQIYQECVLAA